MKKAIAGLFVAATMAGVSGAAFAADTGFYAGVTLGRSSTGALTGVNMTKSTDTVLGVLGGYQFTKNWGAEAFYTGAGKWTGTGSISGAAGSGKTDAWGIVGVGTLPLSDAFSLYGKLGYASTKSTGSAVLGAVVADLSATRGAATYGLGGVYNVNSSVGIRFGWDRYGSAYTAGNGVKYGFNSNVYSLGGVFKF